MGYGMYATGEYSHLIFPQKFFSKDYYFAYASADDNFVGLLQLNPDSVDTTEAEILDEDVVDTIRYDML